MHIDRVHTCPPTSAQQKTQSEGLAGWLATEGEGGREGKKRNGRGERGRGKGRGKERGKEGREERRGKGRKGEREGQHINEA